MEDICDCLCTKTALRYVRAGAVFTFSSSKLTFSTSAYPAQGQRMLDTIPACSG